ncbi:MAG: iron-sulfur cluster assembly accessory protein [Elusimicrobia bacterium]|nr:iron-sulfur cluster assembly accessory protein [Elusimicrobiota bacterium]
MLTLTPKAVEKIQSFLQSDESSKGKGLRVTLKPSGCAGYEYSMGFDDKKPQDIVLVQPGFEVLLDNNSLPFLEQAVIDYSEDAMSSGFKIKNPQEKGSCGCGKSKKFD